MWCIPKVDAEFVARMVDVLKLYARCVDDAGRPEPVVIPDRLVATSDRPSSAMPTRDTTPPPAVFGPTLAAQSDAVEVVAPNILSLAHWARLRDGELYAAQRRVDWASLLRRTLSLT